MNKDKVIEDLKKTVKDLERRVDAIDVESQDRIAWLVKRVNQRERELDKCEEKISKLLKEDIK